MLSNIKKVLVIAPHTDDGEFGCGGTINKLIKLGIEVHYVAYSLFALIQEFLSITRISFS